MVKIMVDATPIMRPIGINSAAKVKIEDIDWCIENSLTRDTEIYALIKGQKSKLYDVVRLASSKPYDKNHTVFNVVPDVKLRIKDEAVYLQLVFYDKTKFGSRTTNFISFVMLTDNYLLSRQMAITQELGLVIRGYYEAIVNMYNELKKGDTTNDS